MSERIGDAARIFTPCDGCGESLILCDADWDTQHRACCGVCTHLRAHPTAEQVEG